MQVGTGAATCITHPGNQITLSDSVTNANKNLIAVRITRPVSIRVLNFNHQSISTEKISENHLPTPRRLNSRSNVIGDINAGMMA